MNRRQIIRLSFLPFLLPVAGGAAAPQESQGKGSAVCRAASDGGGTARRPGTGSYVSLAVMLSGLVALGVLVYFAFFRFPPIPGPTRWRRHRLPAGISAGSQTIGRGSHLR